MTDSGEQHRGSEGVVTRLVILVLLVALAWWWAGYDRRGNHVMEGV